MQNRTIDNGRAFDWGCTSVDYAKYRDIYPELLYQALHQMGIGNKEQHILDVGTGTGVFFREAWNGRMRACRGVGASLPPEQVEAFSHTHLKMLRETMPENFSVLHEISILKFQFL